MRLADGTTEYEGRVELCINRMWGTVCSYTNYYNPGGLYFDVDDTKVVCRQLGHRELGNIQGDGEL